MRTGVGYVCACGKRGFMSKRHARAAHRRVSWRVRVYRCPISGLYHATNAEKRERSYES